jgi:dipeptidyl aminopeptidase/acylaminoacyl peptidase
MVTPAAQDTLEKSLKSMARIGRCTSPSFSPDATRIAFISDLSGLPQIWIVPTAGGWPELVTTLDDQIGAVSWSPDGAWLAFVLSPGGGMNRQVYLIRPDGTDLQLLTAGGKDNNSLGGWTYNGEQLIIGSNRRTPDAIDGYLFDRARGVLNLVSKNDGIGQLTDISRDNIYGILNRMEYRGNDNLYLIELTSGQEQLLTPHEGPGSFSTGHFSPNGRTIYLSSDQQREATAFARIELDTADQPGPIEILAARDDAELESFVLNEQGTRAVLNWNVAGRNELTFFNLTTGEQHPGPELPGELVTNLTWSHDGHFLSMVITGSTQPADIWVLEYATDHLWQVTHSPHAGIKLDQLIRPELISFPAHDGLQISAWLYRPHNLAAPYPTVIDFHGGPEGQARPSFSSNYQALLASGIAVVAPNVRGSSGFGKTFINLDNGTLRFNAIKDIKACHEHLKQTGIASAGQIGIMGGSYGGYMTMAALTEYPEDFAAGANLYGIVNFATFFAQTEPWMAAISKIKYGDPDTQATLLHDLSPINKLDRVQAPTLVLYGANDTNVPVIEAEQVVDYLKKHNVPVKYVLFPDEGHGFLKTINRIRATTEIVHWFTKYLKADL